MTEMYSFFSAPTNLDEEESSIIANVKEGKGILVETETGQKVTRNTLFIANDLDNSSVYSHSKNSNANITEKRQEPDKLVSLEEIQKKNSSDMLVGAASNPIVKSTFVDYPKERVIIRFEAPEKNIANDIDIPLDITANDLVVGLNTAYHLGLDISDARQCYLSCENPIALLRGNKTLGEFGIRDGSLIAYYR